jgi:hypothetical protein
MHRYNHLCIAAIHDLLEHGEHAAVMRHDPNGHESLRRAKQVRRKLRELQRRQVPIEGIQRRFLAAFEQACREGRLPEPEAGEALR